MKTPQKVVGVFLHSEARWSPAYQKLTLTARDILRLFLEKRIIKKQHILNNGKIVLTHSYAQKILKKSKKAINDAFHLLIGVGFIEVNKVGEGREGHRYTIHIGANQNSDRDANWRFYPEKSYFPEKKKTDIGKETRFKKHPTKEYHNGSLVV